MSETFRSLIDRRAIEHPDKDFLIDPNASLNLTYADLQLRCWQFSELLRAQGMKQGDHVAFMLDNGIWTSIVMLGTMYAGCVTVPLNVVASPANLSFALKNSRSSLVFVSYHHKQLFDSIHTGESKAEIQVQLVDSELGFDLPEVNHKEETNGGIQFSDAAMILHTSGTVGMPKGTVLTHQNLIAGGKNVILAHQVTEHDRALCVLPLYHINGQVVTVVAPLVSGSSVVMPHKFSTSEFWNLVEEFHCTWISIVPTMAKFLLDAAHNNPEIEDQVQKLECLRFARSASSAMPAGMHKDFEETFRIPLFETMGLTETAAPILANPVPPGERISGSVGIPFGDDVKIVDDHFNSVPFDTVGEIIVRGDNVFSHYFEDTEATQRSLTPDGWFRTGDLGCQKENGYFYVTGRTKELIIKGGENISPREIDDVLYHHEDVLEVGAFGLPDDTYGQVVAVGVVLKPNRSQNEAELIEYCHENLGKFRSPSKVFFC